MNFIQKLITPELAKEYLALNIEVNRNKKRDRILLYSKEILEGRWIADTGETVKISKSGRLIDGQNRLYAIIKANKAAYITIVTGVDDEAFKVIDSGASRNAGDAFKIAGVPHSTLVPSIISTYNLLIGEMSPRERRKSSSSALLDQYFEDDDFWDASTNKALIWYKDFSRVLPPSLIGGLYTYFYSVNQEDAHEFMDQVCSGLNVELPIIKTLRLRLIDDAKQVRKMPLVLKVAYIIKTWNFFRKKDSKAKFLKFDSASEKMPVAK